MDVYCEFVEGNSSKFWAVKQDGEKTTVRYGKIGKSGSTQVKSHGTAAKAEKFATKQLAVKVKKGYVEKDGPDGHNDAPAGFTVDPELKAAFEQGDTDKSGKLSVKELRKLLEDELGASLSQGAVKSLVAKFDNEDDGELTFNEFVLCARYLEEHIEEFATECNNAESPTKKPKTEYTKHELRTFNDCLHFNAVAQLVAIGKQVTGDDDCGLAEVLGNEDGYITLWIDSKNYRIYQFCIGGTIVGGVVHGGDADKTLHGEISDGQFSAVPWDDEDSKTRAAKWQTDLGDNGED